METALWFLLAINLAAVCFLVREMLLWGRRTGVSPVTAGPSLAKAELPTTRHHHVTTSALCWVYFGAFTTAELITELVNPLIGQACYGLILVYLLVAASLASGTRRQQTVALSLVPLVRLLSLTPMGQISNTYRYILIYLPLAAATFVVMRLVGLSPKRVGLTLAGWRLQLLVAATGLAFGFLEYAVLRPSPFIPSLDAAHAVFPAIVLFVTTGFGEEFLFRGVLQRTSIATMGRWGIPYVSFVFSILHIGHLSALDVVIVFGISMFFGLWVKRTGSLLGVTLSHGLTNVVLYFVMPLLLT